MTPNLTRRRKEPSVWFSVGCDSPQRSMEVRLPAAARSTVSTDSSWQASLTYASLTVHRARPGVSRPGPWPYDRTCDVQHTTQDAYAERSDNSSCAHGSESRNFVFVLAGLGALVKSKDGFLHLDTNFSWIILSLVETRLPSRGRSGSNGEECKGTRVHPGTPHRYPGGPSPQKGDYPYLILIPPKREIPKIPYKDLTRLRGKYSRRITYPV